MDREKLYKASELAELLGVCIDTIYRWGKQGKLETVRVGGTVRFRGVGNGDQS